MESPDSASFNASYKLLDSPSGEKLNQIVRQFTNAQELAYLQSDIFGFSPPPYSSAPATLTLPSFLEPYSDFDGITNKATPSRKRSFSSISEPLFSAKEGSEPFAAPVTPAPAAAAAAAPAASANKRRKQSAAAAAAESAEKKSDKSEAKLNHTRSERERRQKMNDSIEQLRKLLPNQCQEVANNKLTILQESAGYIRHLKDSIVLCQAEVQRSDESYRRLWDEYRRLRHLLSLYSFPDPHHQMQPCALPPFHIMPLDPLARQPSSSLLFGPGGEEANNQCLNAAYHFQQSLASPSQSLPACAVCTSPTCADASHAGSPSSGTPEPSPK